MNTAEFLLETLNKDVDFQSRTVKDASEWELNQVVFKKNLGPMGDTGHRPFRFSNKMLISSHGSYSQQREACQIIYTNMKAYAF